LSQPIAAWIASLKATNVTSAEMDNRRQICGWIPYRNTFTSTRLVTIVLAMAQACDGDARKNQTGNCRRVAAVCNRHARVLMKSGLTSNRTAGDRHLVKEIFGGFRQESMAWRLKTAATSLIQQRPHHCGVEGGREVGIG
jgi:hypothetical protein